MEPAKLPPSKRMAPAPPVPAKAKPAPVLVSNVGQASGPPWSTEVPAVPRPEERLALEDLKAEVRSLHILVDLMRVQHLRDLEDMRLEICQERAKRQALQAEIERVKKVLPC
ncbi:SH3 domain-containing protein 21 [Grus japonensis]|uniref:SH3 domain-containing protein 21 n=1 Tax=Grus japonensis TaxID=30415 RepID=A0ABC9XP60_GRUJA